MIAHNASSNSGHLTGVTGATFAHDCGVGSDRFLAVLVASGESDAGWRTVSSMTYAGASMLHATADADQGFERTEAWYKFAPATGSNNVVVSMGGNNANLDIYAVSFTGAHQSALDNQKGATQTGEDDVTETIATNTANAFVMSVCQTVDSQTSGIGGSQTSIGSLNGGWSRASYSGAHATPATITHTYVVGGANNACMSLLAIKPAVATSQIKVVSGVAQASVKKMSGVAIASVKKASGVANT